MVRIDFSFQQIFDAAVVKVDTNELIKAERERMLSIGNRSERKDFFAIVIGNVGCRNFRTTFQTDVMPRDGFIRDRFFKMILNR